MEQPSMKNMGLRERKKLKTRMVIQQHALRLFREQGYAQTTVEEIAEAAEISPSTFFRYYPTKESVVLTDFYDPVFLDAFISQPPNLPPLQALRAGIKEIYNKMSGDEQGYENDRGRLILEIPELRAAMINNVMTVFQFMTESLAKRTHKNADDPAVRMFTGAIMGVLVGAAMRWIEDPSADFLAMVDEAISYIEAGLPL